MPSSILALILGLVVAATPATPPEPSGSKGAPDAAVAFEGHRYLLVDEGEDLSWDGAQAACVASGGHLVVVTTQAEADFIAGLCDGRYMFLGATDAAEEGTWTWVDGSPFTFTFWMDGQPNDYGGTEDYLATYSKGKWVDVDGSGDDFWMPTGYICEWD